MKDIPLKMNGHKNSEIDNSPSTYMTKFYIAFHFKKKSLKIKIAFNFNKRTPCKIYKRIPF